MVDPIDVRVVNEDGWDVIQVGRSGSLSDRTIQVMADPDLDDDTVGFAIAAAISYTQAAIRRANDAEPTPELRRLFRAIDAADAALEAIHGAILPVSIACNIGADERSMQGRLMQAEALAHAGDVDALLAHLKGAS